MKKTLFCILFTLATTVGFALPLGNPCNPTFYPCSTFFEDGCSYSDGCWSFCDMFNARIGFYGDYVFNRHFYVDKSGKPDIEQFHMNTNAGIIALNICNRVDLFATLGASDIQFAADTSDFITVEIFNGVDLIAKTSTAFSWSIGGDIALLNWCGFCLGFEGQYFYTSPDLTRITAAALFPAVDPSNNLNFKYQEWQVGLGISQCVRNWIMPYAGIRLSGAWMSIDGVENVDLVGFANTPLVINDIKSKGCWGYAVGVTLMNCKNTALTVEGRFGNELAAHVNGQIRF